MRESHGRERGARGWRYGWVLLLALTASTLGGAADGVETPGCKVIVNAEVDGAAVPRDLLADIFLKKVNRWGDGLPIKAVDQSMSSDVRRQFTRNILGRSSAEMLNYWVQQINKGTRPPAVMESDVEVLEYVAGTPGAIGYVSEDTTLDGEDIKVLRISG